jgi:hypothetical protein
MIPGVEGEPPRSRTDVPVSLSAQRSDSLAYLAQQRSYPLERLS